MLQNVEVMDRFTAAQRSLNMSRIRAKNTQPELAVRRLLHRMGYRFRLHAKNLPGKPDLVFPGRHAVVFVHGCYWHRHEGCRRAFHPKSRIEFWSRKFEATMDRDSRVTARLLEAGWKVLVIWECEVLDVDAVTSKLTNYLGAAGGTKDGL